MFYRVTGIQLINYLVSNWFDTTYLVFVVYFLLYVALSLWPSLLLIVSAVHGLFFILATAVPM